MKHKAPTLSPAKMAVGAMLHSRHTCEMAFLLLEEPDMTHVVTVWTGSVELLQGKLSPCLSCTAECLLWSCPVSIHPQSLVIHPTTVINRDTAFPVTSWMGRRPSLSQHG